MVNGLQGIADSLDNLTMQSYIDSLINAGNISDSLIQVYTDSLNTVQNAYIDSLHNAQQNTLTALANNALNSGFMETEVFNGSMIKDAWTDLDLNQVVGAKTTLVLLKVSLLCSSCGGKIWFRSNGETSNFTLFESVMISEGGVEFVELWAWNGSPHVENETGKVLVITDSNGIIEYGVGSDIDVKLSVLFYLNQ